MWLRLSSARPSPASDGVPLGCRGFLRIAAGALVIIFLSAQTPRALAGQAKPLVKIVSGYGSTDGGVAVLGFAKETKLFEKSGLDVVLVGMGTGSVSLRALIAKDLQISRCPVPVWCKPPCTAPIPF